MGAAEGVPQRGPGLCQVLRTDEQPFARRSGERQPGGRNGRTETSALSGRTQREDSPGSAILTPLTGVRSLGDRSPVHRQQGLGFASLGRGPASAGEKSEALLVTSPAWGS